MAVVQGVVTGGGFSPCTGVGSRQRPPELLKGRGLFFFFKGDSRVFFLALGGLPLPPSSPSSSHRSPLLHQDLILFERFSPQFCGGLGHPRVVLFFFFLLFLFHFVFILFPRGAPPSCLCCLWKWRTRQIQTPCLNYIDL